MISIFWSAATLSAALPSWFRPSTAFSDGQPEDHEPGAELLQGDDADDRRADQHELHQVAVLAQEGVPAGLLLRLGELVRPHLRAAALDLGGVEPVLRVDPEPGARLLGRQPVPGDHVPARPLGRRGCRRHRE